MATKGEYGRGELYEKHGSWYGRWRTPARAKRNRKVGPVKRTGVPGSTGSRRAVSRRA